MDPSILKSKLERLTEQLKHHRKYIEGDIDSEFKIVDFLESTLTTMTGVCGNLRKVLIPLVARKNVQTARSRDAEVRSQTSRDISTRLRVDSLKEDHTPNLGSRGLFSRSKEQVQNMKSETNLLEKRVFGTRTPSLTARDKLADSHRSSLTKLRPQFNMSEFDFKATDKPSRLSTDKSKHTLKIGVQIETSPRAMERNFTTRNNTMKDVSLMEKSDIRTAMSKNQHHPSQKQTARLSTTPTLATATNPAHHQTTQHPHSILGNSTRVKGGLINSIAKRAKKKEGFSGGQRLVLTSRRENYESGGIDLFASFGGPEMFARAEAAQEKMEKENLPVIRESRRIEEIGIPTKSSPEKKSVKLTPKQKRPLETRCTNLVKTAINYTIEEDDPSSKAFGLSHNDIMEDAIQDYSICNLEIGNVKKERVKTHHGMLSGGQEKKKDLLSTKSHVALSKTITDVNPIVGGEDNHTFLSSSKQDSTTLHYLNLLKGIKPRTKPFLSP